MALIKCGECKQEISSKADKCPKCGAPVKAKGGCGGCLAVLVIAILAAVSIPQTAKQDSAGVKKQPSDSAKAQAEPAVQSKNNPRQFESFEVESRRVELSLPEGKSKFSPPMEGLGSLFGNISGTAQTVKWFVNESAQQKGRVKDVKLMWNDWTTEGGFGKHADKEQALKCVILLAEAYAMDLKKEMVAMFFGSKEGSLKSGRLIFKYTFRKGQGIDEHLITVTEVSS